MIKGKPVIDWVTKDLILKVITSYDIYRWYFGEFKPNTLICNHLRGEDNPSLVIGTKTGEYRHFDYGDAEWRGTCFDLVAKMYNTDFAHALLIVDKDFKLGLGSGAREQKVVTWNQPKDILVTPPPLIQVTTKRWTKEALRWWNLYHQDESDLKREEIYFPHKIYRNRKALPILDSLLTFCYFESGSGCWKLYRPNGEKPGMNTPIYKWKWDGNIPFNIIEGLDNIKNCDVAIIGKARKDVMVIKKALGTNCACNLQAEDPNCFTQENIDYINENSETQVITSDNDKKGKQLSWWLTNEYGWRHCNVPEGIPLMVGERNCKDFAEWGRDYGLEVIYNHFKDKIYGQ